MFAVRLLDLDFDPEERGRILFQNVSKILSDYTDYTDLNSKLSMKQAEAGENMTLLVSCLAQVFVLPKYWYLPEVHSIINLKDCTLHSHCYKIIKSDKM